MKTNKLILGLCLLTVLVSCKPNSSEVSSSQTSSVSVSSLDESSLVEVSSENTSSENSSSESSLTKELTTVLYSNPVYNFDFPDPSVIRHTDGKFYAYATGAKVIKSDDLANWTALSNAITRPTWGTSNAGIWAPDVQYIGDQYVMYYSLSVWDDPNPGIGIATAPHPEGPWTDHGKFFRSTEIGVNNSIDPMVYVDDDERVYMFWGSFRGIYAIELTADGLDFKDGSVAAAAENKVRVAGNPTEYSLDVSTFEGVYIIKKDGFYYMFLSTGQCCSGSYSYNVKVGRASSILGEYKDHLGRSMLQGAVGTQVVSQNSHFIAVGHNSIIQDDAGNYFMAYHGFDATVETRSQRKLLLDKLIWDEDNWPATLGKAPSNNRRTGPELYL